MIYLGFDDTAKEAAVERYAAKHGLGKVFVLSPTKFAPSFAAAPATDPVADCDGKRSVHVCWEDIIRYRFFYRLLQEIRHDTLVVVNECLRTTNRHELTYNCIRNFLQQTPHQLIFQRLPIIDSLDDFMILVDFETRSRWKRESFRREMLDAVSLEVHEHPVTLRRVHVPTSDAVKASYERQKRKLIDGLGPGDPHVIPRQLHLFAGRAKRAAVDPGKRYVGRNNRFKLPNLETYAETRGRGERTVFEFCHRFIDWTDFLAATDTTELDAMVSDLRVDGWYFDRFTQWGERLSDAYATLQQPHGARRSA